MCGSAATERDVNRHLDEGCPEQKPVPNGAKREEDDGFSDSDLDYSAIDIGDGDPPPPSSSSQPSPPKYKASRSISNRPNKFGGVESLSQNGDVRFHSPSPSKRPRWPSNSPRTPRTPSSAEKNSLTSAQKLEPAKKALNFNHVPFTQSKRQDPNHIPYYLVNFECILRGVIEETDDKKLFLDEELATVIIFRSLDLDSRKLYVRMFQRKHNWLKIGDIKYEEIYDVAAAFQSLLEAGLLNEGSEVDDLETILNLLSSPDVKKLFKEFGLKSKGTQKGDFVSELVKHCKRPSICGFFKVKTSNSSNPMKDKVKSRARQMLGQCYKLADTPRTLFLRIMALYSLSGWWEERENNQSNGPPQQLTTLLLKNTGKLIFPDYKISRERDIFRNRNDLLKFEEACAYESEFSEHFDDKNYEDAVRVFDEKIKQMFFVDEASKDDREVISDLNNYAQKLPSFLRKFTSGSVLTYVVTKTVDAFEKAKDYESAVSLLEKLLSQNIYLNDYRGLWYERLSLDYDTHLKMPDEALKIVKRGLEDPHVRVARKLALCQRATKIFGMKKNVKLKELHEESLRSCDNWKLPSDPIEDVIQGKQMAKDNIPGAKTVFVIPSRRQDDSCENYLLSVEEYVREYYINEFPNGLHAEGSVVNTICTILFWDIIYGTDIPDVFRSPSQVVPLDFDTDEFYKFRRVKIDDRLTDIFNWSEEERNGFVSEIWHDNCHVTSSPANWALFQNLEQFQGLLGCLTNKQLSGICERLIKNHRHTRSGFPDLTLWNVGTKELWFCEVKGPGDRLSNKQILWLEYLTELGVRASVCHVEATNNRHVKMEATKKRKLEERSPEKTSLTKKNQVSKTSSNKKTRSQRSNERKRRNSGEDFKQL